MLKKICIFILSMFLIFNISGCSKETDSMSKDVSSEGKLEVIVSFNAMKDITEVIGGDKVKVTVMVPKGVEPHDFEPKPKDMAMISKGKVFIYNGLGMEGWAQSTLKSIDNKNLMVVEASKNCELIKNSDEEEIKEHGQYDPHVWLSLKQAKLEANNIKEAFSKVDVSNKETYEDNYNKFAVEIDKLQKEYEEKFTKVKNKNFVTGHAAFAYLCRDFNLKQNSVEEVFSEGEATTAKLKELVDYCKANNINTIFMEEMASPKVSEALGKEVGAKVQVINTLEAEGKYIETMRENLEKIYNSLK